jgi:hypothetical protein
MIPGANSCPLEFPEACVTAEEIDRVGAALVAFFVELENALVETAALKRVLRDAAHPNDLNAPCANPRKANSLLG